MLTAIRGGPLLAFARLLKLGLAIAPRSELVRVSEAQPESEFQHFIPQLGAAPGEPRRFDWVAFDLRLGRRDLALAGIARDQLQERWLRPLTATHAAHRIRPSNIFMRDSAYG